MKRTEPFEFYQPATLEEARRLVSENGPGGRFLAGGTDLVIAMKEKGLLPKYIVDLKRVPGLAGIRENSDGTITLEELTTRISAYSSGGASSTPHSSSSGPGYGGKFRGSSDKTASTGPKKSYRFLTPTERLPKGMPDWFIKNDADGDGQIMMSEYATNWTDATAAEFAKLDLDGDGIIVPSEALGGEKK